MQFCTIPICIQSVGDPAGVDHKHIQRAAAHMLISLLVSGSFSRSHGIIYMCGDLVPCTNSSKAICSRRDAAGNCFSLASCKAQARTTWPMLRRACIGVWCPVSFNRQAQPCTDLIDDGARQLCCKLFDLPSYRSTVSNF